MIGLLILVTVYLIVMVLTFRQGVRWYDADERRHGRPGVQGSDMPYIAFLALIWPGGFFALGLCCHAWKGDRFVNAIKRWSGV